MFIYKKDLAMSLVSEGFRLFKVEPNKNDTTKDVYIFEDTEELVIRLVELGINVPIILLYEDKVHKVMELGHKPFIVKNSNKYNGLVYMFWKSDKIEQIINKL